MSGARGEATIQAGEREVNVLFTNRALAEVEGTLKRSIIVVAQGIADGTSGITEAAHLLRTGMEAARRDAKESGRVSLLDAFSVLDEAGYSKVVLAVSEAIAEVLSYGTEGPDAKNP